MFASAQNIDIIRVCPGPMHIQEIREPEPSTINKVADTVFGTAVFSVKAAVVLTAVTILTPAALTLAASGTYIAVLGTVIVASLVVKTAAVALATVIVLGVVVVLTAAKVIKLATLFVLFTAVTSMVLGESKNERFIPENRAVVCPKLSIERRVTEQELTDHHAANLMSTIAATSVALFASLAIIKLVPTALQYGSDLVAELATPIVSSAALPIL